MRRRSWAIAMAATLVAGVAALAGTAAAGSAAKPPIKIGVEVSLTGGFAALGQSTKNGIVLRARQINAHGGVNGRKIALEILDDGTNPATAVTNTQKLIDDGVDAILGFNGGQTQVPAAAVAVRANVLTLALSGYNAGQPSGPAYFWSSPTFDAHLGAFKCYITKYAKAKSVTIINSNDAGATLAANGLKPLLDAAGISVTQQTVPLGSTDVTVAVSKARDANPDLIFDDAVGATGGLIAKTAHDLGLKTPIFGWLAWAQTPVIKLYAQYLDGVVQEGFISEKDPLPYQKTFVKTWQRNYPSTALDPYAAWSYDSVTALADAFAKVPNAKQSDGVKLGAALEKIKFKGAVGPWTFGRYNAGNAEFHTGIHRGNVLWMRIQNGDLRLIKNQPHC